MQLRRPNNMEPPLIRLSIIAYYLIKKKEEEEKKRGAVVIDWLNFIFGSSLCPLSLFEFLGV